MIAHVLCEFVCNIQFWGLIRLFSVATKRRALCISSVVCECNTCQVFSEKVILVIHTNNYNNSFFTYFKKKKILMCHKKLLFGQAQIFQSVWQKSPVSLFHQTDSINAHL